MSSKGRGRAYQVARAKCLEGATHCTWCSKPISNDLPPDNDLKATADHLIALKDGGTYDADNLVPSCRKCNIERGARDPSVLNHDLPGTEDW